MYMCVYVYTDESKIYYIHTQYAYKICTNPSYIMHIHLIRKTMFCYKSVVYLFLYMLCVYGISPFEKNENKKG